MEAGQPDVNQPSYASKAKTTVTSIACQTDESSLAPKPSRNIPTPDTSGSTVNTTKPKVNNKTQTSPPTNKPSIVRPKDPPSNNNKSDQNKTKSKKDREILTSNREKKGSRFHALRNIDLELALHAEEDGGLDELMDVVPETQLSHRPSNTKS